MFRNINKTIDLSKIFIHQFRFMQLKPSITGNEFYKKDSQKQILQDCLDITNQQAYRLLRNNKFISNIKNLRLLNTLDTLNKLGISKKDIYNNPLTLNFYDTTIEHNYMYLKEVGFKSIDASTLLRFRIIIKKPISLLKIHGLIPENTNVAENLKTYFDPIERNIFPKSNFTEDMTASEIHLSLLQQYFMWRLNCTKDEVEKLFKTYDKCKYKSVKIICDLINYLINDWGFTSKKLLQHGYLIDLHPNHIKRLVKQFPKLGGNDIKTVMFKHPKLLTIPIENFYEISKYIKDFGIKDEAIQKCYEIFSLSPESVLNRLNELKKVPEFEVLSKNPRILLLIYCQNKAKLRLEILRNLNVKNASLHILCAAGNVFDKYTQEGSDRTKGVDLLNFLTSEFNKSFEEIRTELSRNQNWYHIPPTTAKETLQFLLEWGVPKSDIAEVPLVLLYRKDYLQKTLNEVQRKLTDDYIVCDFKQQLNLCLYELEKTYHFSGNGVWGAKNERESEIEKD